MGIKDQFKDKAQELADQAKQAKQSRQGMQDDPTSRGAQDTSRGAQDTSRGAQDTSRGTQDEASERLRRAREDRDRGQGHDTLDDELGEGPERYRS